MTPPRWLREQRRAQATTTRNLTHLPLALDEVSHNVVRLRADLARVSDAVEELRWPPRKWMTGLSERGAS